MTRALPRHTGLGGQVIEALGLAAFSAAFLLPRAAGSALVDRYGGLAVARWVLLAESAGLVLVASASSGPAAVYAVAVTGFGLGLIYPASTRLTLDRAASRQCGRDHDLVLGTGNPGGRADWRACSR